MNKFNNEEDKFEVLRTIQKNPQSSQRKLANELGFSLGKLNYCVKALKQKGLIKINNFKFKRELVFNQWLSFLHTILQYFMDTS